MKKSTLILLGVLVLGAMVYFYTMGSPSEDASPFVNQLGSESASEGAEVLALLNQMRSLEINPAIFSSPVYQTLQDYSIVVPPQPVGRPNPFAPVR